jgi:hypothetical protein
MADSCSCFYQYRPLPSERFIRLLELYPGQTDDNIRCGLRETTLEDASNYEAISYAWGDPINKVNIFCDEKIILVTLNLKNALHRLKLKDRSRILWADAICINQHDDLEKGSQVKRMARIYGKATRVCVWLECTIPQMLPAFELIAAIVSHKSAISTSMSSQLGENLSLTCKPL